MPYCFEEFTRQTGLLMHFFLCLAIWRNHPPFYLSASEFRFFVKPGAATQRTAGSS
jgi:hypothetical protein